MGNDKPGSNVTVGIIRAGKSKKIEVTLGERKQGALQPQRVLRPPLAEGRRRNGERSLKHDPWESFDSLTLSRIGEDRYSATIKYRNDEGKIVTHRFKGTREEIEQDIENEGDLPANERRHLLRALGLERDAVPLEMPELWVLPDGRVILELPEDFDKPDEEGAQPPL